MFFLFLRYVWKFSSPCFFKKRTKGGGNVRFGPQLLIKDNKKQLFLCFLSGCVFLFGVIFEQNDSIYKEIVSS